MTSRTLWLWPAMLNTRYERGCVQFTLGVKAGKEPPILGLTLIWTKAGAYMAAIGLTAALLVAGLLI